ncbi:MAG TPA: Abi-alpha family protein [Jatrophihabitans sp.]|nr:Abi-alpha family protein [Jatrophihabitans sp.]
MATPAEQPAARPRPRPNAASPEPPSAYTTPTPRRRSRWPGLGGRGSGQLALPEPPQPGQVVAAAGSAIVAAARVGRLLGRSGWRIAKQLPVVGAVENQAQRLRQAAIAEMARMLDLQQPVGAVSFEEQRVMMLVRDAPSDPEPLRTAMNELLERSAAADVRRGRDYLFGTIVSQLVPDEARILAVLAGGRLFAAIDVLSKQVGRSTTRTVLANASTVGSAAGVALPDNVPTYLSRLDSLGLLDFSQPIDDLDAQFAELLDDPRVRTARAEAENGKLGSARIVRKSVTLSPLGREFWSACAPSTVTPSDER